MDPKDNTEVQGGGEEQKELTYEEALKKFQDEGGEEPVKPTEVPAEQKPAEQKPATPAADDDVLKDYDPAQLATLEKIVDAINRKNGVVTKAELEERERKAKEEVHHSTMKSVVEQFVTAHPEYAAVNDKSGRMQRLLNEHAEEYNCSTPERLKKALEKSHEAITAHILGLAKGANKVGTEASVSKEVTPSPAGGSPAIKLGSTTSTADANVNPQIAEMQETIKSKLLAGLPKKQ